MKRLLRMTLALLLCGALLLTPLPAQADFGGYSGDSDYGGSYDSGSSYDYGSSYDWGSNDWGSDDDDDYDSYASGSSSYYDDGGYSDGDSVNWGLDIVIFILIVLFILWRNSRKKKRGGGNHNGPRGGGRPPVNPGGQRMAASALRPMAEYNSLDDSFDQGALSERLANLYVQMQNCWQDKDIQPVRPYFTDAMFAQMQRQVETMRKQGRTNYVERIAVLGVELRGFYQRGADDYLVAELRTRIVDYTLDDKSGKLLSGNQNKEKFMTYQWELTRPSGVQTSAVADRSNLHCPNCGAPLTINESARCPYCDAVITLEEHDWAIYAIKGISQRTQ